MAKYIVALVAALILNATANLLIKASAGSPGGSADLLSGGAGSALKALAGNWLFLLGLVCFALNLVAYQYALKVLPISVAYPIMVASGYAIIVVVAGGWMQERLVTAQWVGVTLILAGVLLVSSGMKSPPRGSAGQGTVVAVEEANGQVH